MSDYLGKVEFAIALADECRLSDFADRSGDGPPCSPFHVAKLAADLMRIGRTLHRLAENDCNGFADEADQEANDKQEARLRNRATVMLAPYNISPIFGGDPRGCVFQLRLPITKRTNGWGGKGYCVPR